MMPIHLPQPSSEERSRLLSVGAFQSRALDRLYQRRTAVENLIQALEAYVKCKQDGLAPCLEPFTVERKCS